MVLHLEVAECNEIPFGNGGADINYTAAACNAYES